MAPQNDTVRLVQIRTSMEVASQQNECVMERITRIQAHQLILKRSFDDSFRLIANEVDSLQEYTGQIQQTNALF